MKLRVIPALRLALLASLVSLPDRAWSEEQFFTWGTSQPFSQRSSQYRRKAEVEPSRQDFDAAPVRNVANWDENKPQAGDTSDLLADGPGELPPPVDWSTRHHISEAHFLQSPGTNDMVGSQIGADDPKRPLYPYKETDYWIAQDADPESWGDLAELPYVQLGWFVNVEATVYSARVLGAFKSDTLLEGVFPGEPMELGVAPLDVNVSPRYEIGYRFERGLGETRFGYQFYGFVGNDTIAGYDQGDPARRWSRVIGHVFDLDFCEFEFNPEGFPLIHPLFKFPGRLGLGRPLVPQKDRPALEMRFLIGGRGANYFTETEATGPSTTDYVSSKYWGAGIHFTWDLNRRLAHDVPIFWHLRADGSGTWGRLDQTFTRTRGGDTATATDPQSWIGVPTVSLEAGFAWAPQLPDRTMRVTLAYHYEEWFSYGQATVSNTDLAMNGVLLRGEWKY